MALVLLNDEGVVVQCEKRLRLSVSDPRAEEAPKKAFFHLGKARATVSSEQSTDNWTLHMVVQSFDSASTLAQQDILELRGRIIHLVSSGSRWEVYNILTQG